MLGGSARLPEIRQKIPLAIRNDAYRTRRMTKSGLSFAALLLGLVLLLVGCGGSDSGDDDLGEAPTPATESTNADTALSTETGEALDPSARNAAIASGEVEPVVEPDAATPFPNASRRILAIGDSNTSGYGNATAQPWPDKLELQLGSEVFRRGVVGDFAANSLARLPGLMSELQPTHVAIMVGTNDGLFLDDPDQTVANIGGMIDVAFAGGAQEVIVGTIPPLLIADAAAVGRRLRIDQGIGSVAINRGAKLARVSEAIGGGTTTMQADGVHLNDLGHAVVAEVFATQF